MTATQPPVTTTAAVSTNDEAIADSSLGLKIFAEMLAGVLLYGGLGYLGDRYFHTSFLVIIGLLLGLGLSMYLVFRRFWGAKA